MLTITLERARVFRIVHIDNVDWILKNGLHCKSSIKQAQSFVQIGNGDLIAKRSTRAIPVAPGGSLDDYIPFYFTPHSPMLYNIKTGYNGIIQRPMRDIVIMVSSLYELESRNVPFLFTDRHAYLQAAEFSDDLADLTRIDWKALQRRDFKRDPNDPGKMERYQAEALVYRHLPVAALTGLVCFGPSQEQVVGKMASACGVDLKVAVRPEFFFS